MDPIGRTVNTIPSHDVVLRRVVRTVAAETTPLSRDELEARLRPLYPKIAVVEGRLSGERSHLYVYRDGRYEPELREPWWAAPDVPCVRIARATGTVVSASTTWTTLMRVDPNAVIGRPYAAFIPPARRGVATALFDALREEQEVHSKAAVVRQDGTTILIEFRAARRNGEIEVFYRPLAGA